MTHKKHDAERDREKVEDIRRRKEAGEEITAEEGQLLHDADEAAEDGRNKAADTSTGHDGSETAGQSGATKPQDGVAVPTGK